MRLFLIFLILLASFGINQAQSISWVKQFQVNNQLNPEMYKSKIVSDGDGGLYLAYMDNQRWSYSTSLLGDLKIHRIDSSGTDIITPISVTGNIAVNHMELFPNGDLLLYAFIYDSVYFDNGTILNNIQNSGFLMRMSGSGMIIDILEMKDVNAVAIQNDSSIYVIGRDQQNYDQKIYHLDGQFQMLSDWMIDNAGFITGLSLFEDGSMRILGMCANDSIKVFGHAVSSIGNYNNYALRIRANRTPAYLFQYDDITCTGVVHSAQDGSHDLYGGTLFQNTIIGNDTVLVNSFSQTKYHITKVDTSGNIHWVSQIGNQPSAGISNIMHGQFFASNSHKTIVWGRFKGQNASWPGIQIQNTNYPDQNAILLILDSTGTITDATLYDSRPGSTYAVWQNEVVANEDESIYLSGLAVDTAWFGTDTINAYYGDEIFFIVKRNGPTSNTGVLELSPTTSYHVYPNPSSGRLTIKTDKPMERIYIQLFDLSGRLLYSEKNAINSEIDLQLPYNLKGSFILRLVSNSATFSKKVILY